MRESLLVREHPANDRPDIRIADMRIRRHWNLPPDANAARFHFRNQHIQCGWIILVFSSHLFIGRSNELHIDLVTRHAGFTGCQRKRVGCSGGRFN